MTHGMAKERKRARRENEETKSLLLEQDGKRVIVERERDRGWIGETVSKSDSEGKKQREKRILDSRKFRQKAKDTK